MSALTDPEVWAYISRWILRNGAWRDYGQWVDEAVWIDAGEGWTVLERGDD